MAIGEDKMKELSKEQLQQIQFMRQMLREPEEGWNGKLEQAKERGREACNRVGIATMVVRFGNKYDYVFEPFFDKRDYKGKIYAEFTPNLDAEV